MEESRVPIALETVLPKQEKKLEKQASECIPKLRVYIAGSRLGPVYIYICIRIHESWRSDILEKPEGGDGVCTREGSVTSKNILNGSGPTSAAPQIPITS